MAAVMSRMDSIRTKMETFSTSFDSILNTSTQTSSAATTGEVAASASTTALNPLLGTTASTAANTAAATAGSNMESRVVAAAEKYIGQPYVWGGESPTGMDCSGLVRLVMKEFGIDVPRVSNDQSRAGVAVSKENLRPGDLVFFDYSSARAGVDHVGIYIGNGKMIHAQKPGTNVKVADVDWSNFTNARRVLPTTDSSASTTSTVNAAKLPASATQWLPTIENAAKAAGVDPNLLSALIWSESAFNAQAKSSAGAIGLGQLMPGTAAGLGVDPYNPADNVKGAATYLSQMLNKFNGNVDLALAGYNAGPGAVRKYGGIPPFRETQNYVATVTSRYEQLGGAR